jgi:serine/threonine-protein kinase
MPAKRSTLPARYASHQLIAYGGMGEVYRATDKTLGRTVAVKVLSERYAKNEEFHARFLREAQTAASLTGEPNVIVIYDVDENAQGVPFIVMEYLPGGTVADRLRTGKIDADQALAWLGQAAEALDRAHARGVVHRDVKPANLLLAEDDTVRVSDFGIARAADQDTLTAAGTVPGSRGYMSPEQIRGEPRTAASDRYALACVAFELLTGRRPFERENQAAEAAAHATEPPPSPRDADANLPVKVDEVFARGLAKQPDDRFASSAAFVSALGTALEDPQTAPTTVMPPPSLPRPSFTRHATRPRRSAVLLAALALLVAGAWLASALSGDDGSGGATVVVTRTEQGKTVTEESTVVVTDEGKG